MYTSAACTTPEGENKNKPLLNLRTGNEKY